MSYQKYRSSQISFNSNFCESCECYRKELKSLKQQLKDAEEENKFLLSKLKTESNPIKPLKPQLKYVKSGISKQKKLELPTPSPIVVKPAGRVKRNLLSVQNHAKLNSIAAGEKNDYIYVSCMLTMLWTKSELMCRSVTGKPSRNIMYGRVAKRPMTPVKVQLIKGKVLIYLRFNLKFYFFWFQIKLWREYRAKTYLSLIFSNEQMIREFTDLLMLSYKI